ncbi:MAG: response regulator, partial [Aquabacterium sp.]
GLDTHQRNLIGMAHSSGSSLLQILNDILDHSKIEAGRLQLESVAFDLAQVVEDTVGVFAQAAQAKGLEIVCEIDARMPPLVTGDPVRVRQVLSNLVSNAVKFTAKGEVIVRAGWTGSPADGGSGALLYVRDSGIGIPAEAQARIFEAFAQADGSTTRRFGGTGLGLNITQRLVELMGGRIALHSQPDTVAGTEFSVQLPLQPAAGVQAPAARNRLDACSRLRGARALVVMPHRQAADVLARYLDDVGMLPVVAADWADAGTRLAQPDGAAPWRLLVIDPEALPPDDRRAVDPLAGLPRDLPVVVLTGMDGRCPAGLEHHRAVRDWLVKPVRRLPLLDALARAEDQPTTPAALPRPELPRHAASYRSRVLLAEDHPVNVVVAEAQLQRLGCEVVIAEDGQQALEQWRGAIGADRFDLVLMDWQMPVMDGLAATRAIRAEELAEGRSRTPIVALTANAMIEDRDRCVEAGMDDHLPKPFDKVQLAGVLARWIPHWRSPEAPDSQHGRLGT